MKRRWIISLFLLPLVVGVGLLVKYWPSTVDDNHCGRYYHTYLHFPGIRTTFIQGKTLNDTLRVDLTLLQATTPDGLVAQTQNGTIEVEQVGTAVYVQDTSSPQTIDDPEFGVDHKGLKRQVTVVGELVFEDDIATIEMQTDDSGQFSFSVPPYYGRAILFLRAHRTNLSEKQQQKRQYKGMLDETVLPDYYVKRDLFFPVFAEKYDFYQCHVPEWAEGTDFDDYTLPDTARLSKMDQTLKDIQVKGRKHRGRHAIDYSKPAYVFDTYDLYNIVTDRGLSFGYYDARQFPVQVSMALLGNYNSDRRMQVQKL